jgi:hypothetical protein
MLVESPSVCVCMVPFWRTDRRGNWKRGLNAAGTVM